jgi:hypothetical protein
MIKNKVSQAHSHKMHSEKLNMMHECSTQGKTKPSKNTPPESTLSPPLASNAKNKTKDLMGEQKLSSRVPRSTE